MLETTGKGLMKGQGKRFGLEQGTGASSVS